MVVEPQGKSVFDHTRDESRHGARRQSLLGLPRELRVEHLHRQYVSHPLPQILGSELDPTRQQVAVFAKLPQRFKQAGTQTVDVGAALNRGNQVDVALH